MRGGEDNNNGDVDGFYCTDDDHNDIDDDVNVNSNHDPIIRGLEGHYLPHYLGQKQRTTMRTAMPTGDAGGGGGNHNHGGNCNCNGNARWRQWQCDVCGRRRR